MSKPVYAAIVVAIAILSIAFALSADMTPAIDPAPASPPADVAPTADKPTPIVPGVPVSPAMANASAAPDSQKIASDLQHMSWEQFRAVIEAVPKMKSDVEAYGPLGWQYVEAHYRSHNWKSAIDKLDGAQKQHLAELVQAVKAIK